MLTLQDLYDKVVDLCLFLPDVASHEDESDGDAEGGGEGEHADRDDELAFAHLERTLHFTRC